MPEINDALAAAMEQIDAAFGGGSPEARARYERRENERRLRLLREIRPRAEEAVAKAKTADGDGCDIQGIDPFTAFVIARHVEAASNDDNTPEQAWEPLEDLASELHRAASNGELFGDPEQMLWEIDEEIAALERLTQ